MASGKRQNFISGAAVLAAAVAVTKVLGALYKIPLGNLLDREGMAHFYVAYNIYSLLLVLSTAGLPLALSRIVAQADALGQENRKRRAFHVALALFLALGLLGGGVMLLLPEQLAAVLHDTMAVPAIRALSPAVLCVCLASAVRGYTQGQGNMRPTAASQVAESCGKLAVGLILVWYLLRRGESPQTVAAGAIAGVSAGSVLGLLTLVLFLAGHRSVRSGTDVPPSRASLAGKLLHAGIPITIGAAGISFITLLDQVLVMHTLQTALGLSEKAASLLYGEYTFGMTLFNLPVSFIYPITVSLMPAISAALAHCDRQGACRSTEGAFRLTALLAFPAGAGLAVLARPVLDLLYPAVPATAAAAAGHLTVLGIACIFACLMIVTGSVLQAYGHAYAPVISLLSGSTVKIAVTRLLVSDPGVGIWGAPIGTLCCYAAIALINLILIRFVIPERPRCGRIFIRPAIAAAVMAALACGVWHLLSDGLHMGRTATILTILLAAAVYGLLCLWLGAVTQEDLKNLPKGENLAKRLKIPLK